MVRRPCLLLLFVFFSAFDCLAQLQDQVPILEGFVTRVASLTDFDVNGYHVVLNKKTPVLSEIHEHQWQTATAAPNLGQAVTITGEIKKKQLQLLAENVVFHSPDLSTRSGIALVDRVLVPAQSGNTPTRILLRADGYVILIQPKAKTTFQPPLKSVTDITEGIWIQYHGKPQSDGILLADSADFIPNAISDKEAKLLDKNDYDPAAVDPKAKQNVAREIFLGTDPKKIPPYSDPAMQARINRIGTSLIPAFQRSLPDDDLRKILFKFQLIDNHKWKDALTLPSGVILIPHQLVDKLQNDSQIATVLADNIAAALEKQSYRMQPARENLTGTSLVGDAAGIFVPGLSLVTGIATYSAEKKIETDLVNQSGRVSLGLLHDAGYDIHQAPIAWWILAKGSANGLPGTSMPPRSANLYLSLSSTWRSYSDLPFSPATNVQTKQSTEPSPSVPNPAKTQ
jgi:hypothetical protein